MALVLENARLVTPFHIEEDRTLVIEQGEITALGQSSSLTVPSGAKKINLAGKTVGQRPVIIGKTSANNYNKVVTLVDIEGRTVGSGVSDDTEGY